MEVIKPDNIICKMQMLERKKKEYKDFNVNIIKSKMNKEENLVVILCC